MLVKQGGKTDYNYKEFYLDSTDDMASIDKTSCCPGSVIYIIATGAVYILSNAKEWVIQ